MSLCPCNTTLQSYSCCLKPKSLQSTSSASTPTHHPKYVNCMYFNCPKNICQNSRCFRVQTLVAIFFPVDRCNRPLHIKQFFQPSLVVFLYIKKNIWKKNIDIKFQFLQLFPRYILFSVHVLPESSELPLKINFDLPYKGGRKRKKIVGAGRERENHVLQLLFLSILCVIYRNSTINAGVLSVLNLHFGLD